MCSYHIHCFFVCLSVMNSNFICASLLVDVVIFYYFQMLPLILLLVASAQGLEGPQTNEQTSNGAKFIYPAAQVHRKIDRQIDRYDTTHHHHHSGFHTRVTSFSTWIHRQIDIQIRSHPLPSPSRVSYQLQTILLYLDTQIDTQTLSITSYGRSCCP